MNNLEKNVPEGTAEKRKSPIFEDGKIVWVSEREWMRYIVEGEKQMRRLCSPVDIEETVSKVNDVLNTEQQEFGLNAWGYSKEDIEKFLTVLLPKEGDEGARKFLIKYLKTCGGKVFGLVICEHIKRNFGAFPYKLEVPPWSVVNNAQELSEIKIGNILRTSDTKEDWLDPRSGVGKSFDSFSYRDREVFKSLQESRELPDHPFVLQQKEWGWGLVIDIAWSPLKKETLMKISTGNTRIADEALPNGLGEDTSATEDTEASVGVWEAKTGYPVLPTVNFGHKSLNPGNIEYINTMVKPFFEAIQKTGINFGVQLEMIVNPEDPYKLKLVQVRPTPERVYTPIDLPKTPEEVFELEHEFIAESPIVNGAFDFTGEVMLFNKNSEVQENFDQASRLINKRNEEKDSSILPRQEEGKIGVYITNNGHTIRSDYSAAAKIYLGGYLKGSEVQLTSAPIRPSSHHGSFSLGYGNKELYDELDQHCGMVHLSELDIDILKELAAESESGSLKLRVISDGLIARIYLLKN